MRHFALALILLSQLLMAVPALATCPGSTAAADPLLAIGLFDCGNVRCLDESISRIESGLDAPGDRLPRYRRHQDLFLTRAFRTGNDSAKTELLQWYENRESLDDDSKFYLTARLTYDRDRLQQVALQQPLAWLDLMRRGFPGAELPPVEPDTAKRWLNNYLEACPESGDLVLSELGYLAVDVSWSLWRQLRRQLLDRDEPPWELLRQGWLIHSEMQIAGKDDSYFIETLLEETRQVKERHQDQAGFWAYRAQIFMQDRDPENAQKSIDEVLARTPCYPLEPHEYNLAAPDQMDRQSQMDHQAESLAALGAAIQHCPPRFETWSRWLQLAVQTPELADPGTLESLRRRYENDLFGSRTFPVSRGLAQLDIALGHQTDQAWQRLETLFEQQLADSDERSEQTVSGDLQRELFLQSQAQGHAWMAFNNGEDERGRAWFRRSEAIRSVSLSETDELERLDPLLDHIEASRLELRWLEARAADQPETALGYALDARRKGLPWVDMQELIEYWNQSGGSSAEFEKMLIERDLDLPAQWRGWRRIEEPLSSFELLDLDGRPWRNDDMAGQQVLVNFWATWCGPCMLELPKVEELHQHYADDPSVLILTINLDRDNPVARRMIEREGWTFPVLVGGGREDAFAGLALPRNWLVDRDSVRRWEQTGFSLENAEHWVPDIVSLLETLDPTD